MFIGPGRPGEIESSGHPFFGSAKEMKTHFVLPRPVFETPLNRPARSMQRKARQEEIMKPSNCHSRVVGKSEVIQRQGLGSVWTGCMSAGCCLLFTVTAHQGSPVGG
jgi:hypothetical protein